MFVPEHKLPMMSTRNRLHEFLVDDAFALKCSGMFWKSEKYCRCNIFHSRALCREAAQSSADRIGETRSGLSPRAAALMSGTVGRKGNSNVRGKIMFWVRAAGT